MGVDICSPARADSAAAYACDKVIGRWPRCSARANAPPGRPINRLEPVSALLKSIGCGSLRLEHAEQTVSLAGWVHRRRDHGGLVFIDLRDSTGLVQVVFHPEEAPDAFGIAERFRAEWVAQITGTVRPRPEGTANPNLDTGDVEVLASAAIVLNPAKTPPFDVSQDAPVDELLRMRYRYLDLRRPFMRENLRMRHRVVKFIRDYLDEREFVEIETPILIKSTPEGARDYLVPSRTHQGSFYALPQSPQQLKQLLMVAGSRPLLPDRPLLSATKTRAPTVSRSSRSSILEMAFVERDDIVALMSDLYTVLIQTIRPDKRLPLPVPHFTYDEAMARFGSDKPDIRFGLEIADFSPIVAGQRVQGLLRRRCRRRCGQGLRRSRPRLDPATPGRRTDRARKASRCAGTRYHRPGRGRRLARRAHARPRTHSRTRAGARRDQGHGNRLRRVSRRPHPHRGRSRPAGLPPP